MAEEKNQKTDFPSELVGPFKNFQESLNKVGTIFDTFHSEALPDLIAKNELDALSKAKLDCMSAFAVNNLVWMWLKTKGENPKEAGVLAEIERVKKLLRGGQQSEKQTVQLKQKINILRSFVRDKDHVGHIHRKRI